MQTNADEHRRTQTNTHHNTSNSTLQYTVWHSIVWHGIGIGIGMALVWYGYGIVTPFGIGMVLVWYGYGVSDTGEVELNSQLQAGWMSRKPTKIFLSN